MRRLMNSTSSCWIDYLTPETTGMADFTKILEQAQHMQGRLEKIQGELEGMTVTATSGGGMVTVEADGKGQITRVRIDPSVVNPADVEMLEDLVLVAVREAQQKAAELAKSEMSKLTGGLNLPFKLPSRRHWRLSPKKSAPARNASISPKKICVPSAAMHVETRRSSVRWRKRPTSAPSSAPASSAESIMCSADDSRRSMASVPTILRFLSWRVAYREVRCGK